uniref:Reverse transcriptase domain-containing protein n=1 Tax=Tanacetum cinerariifolium TaxID=118510 RepID=A0A6L2KAA2_TANCI|nr:reverse transcriptase domain-containing protein [Tanacetum cinerariifolium]
MIEYHSMDIRLKDLMMMVLVMHTEEDDTVLHIEKTGMWMLVVEINVGGMTADVVDKLTCSSDVVQPRQVDLRRFQELVVLCPNMVPNNEKLIEVFIDGLPRSIKGNVTALKPQTLEEAINIARRSRVDPTLLNDFEMATGENGDLPVPDLRTIEELCQPTLNRRGGPIASIAIQATNFGLKNDTIQQVQNSFQFHGLSGDDANKHLDKFLHERYKLLSDRCPNHNMLPITQIDTFYNGLTLRHRDTINAAAGGTFMKRRPEECYVLIKNMIAHHNDWDTSAQRSEPSSFITSSFDPEIIALKAEMVEINQNLIKVLQINQQVKAVTPSYETCGGPHSYNDCPATVGQTQNVYAAGAYQGGNSYQPQGNNQGRNQFFQGASHGQNPPPAYQAPAYQAPGYQAPVHQPPIPQPQVMTTTEFTNYMKANDAIIKNLQTNMTSLTNSKLELKNMFGQFMKMNTASSLGSGTLPSNTITNPKEDLKGITTRSGNAYQGPTVPTTSSSLPKVVERETEVTKDTVPPTKNGSTKDVQPPVVQIETLIPNSKPVVAPVAEPVVASVSAPNPNPKPSIPYPYRLHDQKLSDKTNDQKEKIFQIFKDLDFNISFADALILMPKFGPTIKSLLTNKDKLFELATTPLNEHCSAVLLKKLPKKLGDPGKFLIPCDFPRMDECLALTDLGASINPMPLLVWNKLSLPKLTPTLMTLKLADRSISRPIGVAEYVFIKVGKFHFPADFVVVDFDADPRVPLILGRSFLKTERALIDAYARELTLRVNNEAVTFNLDQTSRYSANYSDMTVNQIDVIDKASKNDKSSIDEPSEVELKDLPPHLEYAFLEGDDKLPVIIAKDLSVEEKPTLIKEKFVLDSEGNPTTKTEKVFETYKTMTQEIRDQLNAEAEAIQIILTGIDNDIYSTVDACPNACEMWKAIERLKQGESINVQDLETNLFWEFGKFTSHDSESLESYYLRFYKMMNELTRNQCNVTNHQVNVQFLLQLQPEWLRFVTLVKQSQELKNVSYHKVYDILKQHQHEVNEIQAEKIARVANPLVLVAQQQPVYHPQTHPTHYNQNSSTRIQQAATRNRGKAIDNSPRIHRNAGYEHQRLGNVAGARETVGSSVVQKSGIQCYNCKQYGHVVKECQKPKRVKDAAYHREKMLLCKQEEARILLNAQQADWKDDTDDESDDQELETHYMYMAKLQQVSPDAVDFGPIFDSKPEQKVQTDDHYDVFAIECQHPEQSESVHKTFLIEQDAHNVIIESVDMNYDSEQIDQNDEDADLAKECELLASLIEKLKCEIDETKNHNTLLETSNKVLVEKLKSEIEDFKNKNKSLTEANNKLSKENDLLFGTPVPSLGIAVRTSANQFAKVMLKYGVTHRLATAYHPQTSGQVKVSNCGLKRILKRTVGENHASWSDKLDDAL